ncbi:hypothetical protein V5O48_007650 [Marasmius crinis-equi]|uniref:MFS general substrate transporter n=1 Tax=Marasmius crinis-equi TaxID=585013 RepID=A0ABR3FG57_9AGAR
MADRFSDPLHDDRDAEKIEMSSNVTGDGCDIDPVAERRLLRKFDWYLLPLFTILYCTSFIDKTSIGNAKIAGLEKDLHMAGFDFNIALTVFYIFYLASEIPSNLALKHFGSMWYSAMIIAFGAVSVGTAYVTSFAGLVVARAALGIAEGCTLSGLVYLLSRSIESDIPESNARPSIPGIITIGIGLLCLWILPSADLQRTRMLTEDERKLALARLDADQSTATGGRKEKTSFRLVMRAFNFNTTLSSICFSLLNITFQGLSLFMPTVIASLGHFTVVESQLRTVPPYLVGSVWAVICGYLSYRLDHRAGFVLLSIVFMVIGYALAVGTKDPQARYAACFLSITGASNAGPMVMAWATGNAAPDTVKAVTTALIPSIGAFGSIIAVWTYLPTDAPDFHKGNSLNLATSILACIIILVVVAHIRRENAKRARGERNYRLEGKDAKELEELGDLHPAFRYHI